jgi:hypothetical protein
MKTINEQDTSVSKVKNDTGSGCAGLPDDYEYLRRVCGCEGTQWARTKGIIFDNRYLFRLEN